MARTITYKFSLWQEQLSHKQTTVNLIPNLLVCKTDVIVFQGKSLIKQKVINTLQFWVFPAYNYCSLVTLEPGRGGSAPSTRHQDLQGYRWGPTLATWGEGTFLTKRGMEPVGNVYALCPPRPSFFSLHIKTSKANGSPVWSGKGAVILHLTSLPQGRTRDAVIWSTTKHPFLCKIKMLLLVFNH